MRRMNCSLEEDAAVAKVSAEAAERKALSPQQQKQHHHLLKDPVGGGRKGSFEEEGDEAEEGEEGEEVQGQFSQHQKSYLMGGKLNLRQRMRQHFSSPSPVTRNRARSDEGTSTEERRKMSGVRTRMASMLIHPVTRRASSPATDPAVTAAAMSPNVYRVDQQTHGRKMRRKERKEVEPMSQPPTQFSTQLDVREMKEKVLAEMQKVSIRTGGVGPRVEDAKSDVPSLVQGLSNTWKQKKSEISTIREELLDVRAFDNGTYNVPTPRQHLSHHRQEESSSSSSSSSLPPSAMISSSTSSATTTGTTAVMFSSLQQDSGFESSSEVVGPHHQDHCSSFSTSSSPYGALPSNYSSAERRRLAMQQQQEEARDYENLESLERQLLDYENVPHSGILAAERISTLPSSYSTSIEKKSQKEVLAALPRRERGKGGGEESKAARHALKKRSVAEKPPRSTKKAKDQVGQEEGEEEHDYQNIDTVLTSQVRKMSKEGQAKNLRSVSTSGVTGEGVSRKQQHQAVLSSTSPSVYQNVDFVRANRSLLMLSSASSRSLLQQQQQQQQHTGPRSNACKRGVSASASSYRKVRKASTTLGKTEEEAVEDRVATVNAAVYENCDFSGAGERAIYQNMVAQEGKLRPAVSTTVSFSKNKSRSISLGSATNRAVQQRQQEQQQQGEKEYLSNNNNSDDAKDDVYEKVKFLRRQVQEVNALLETRPGSKRRSKSHSTPRPVSTGPADAKRKASDNLIVPRPSPSLSSAPTVTATSKRRFLPSLPQQVEPARIIGGGGRKAEKEKEDVNRKRTQGTISLQKNTSLTSSEQRRAHFKALLSRFDSSPELVKSSAAYPTADHRKSSLLVSLGDGGRMSTSLVRDRRQRFSVEVAK